MRRSSLRWAIFLAATSCVAGCLDRRGLTPEGTGGESAAPSSATAGGAGGTDQPSASVTSTSAGTGCTPSPEVCDDGLDNDCDGTIDCADSDCAGLTTNGARACVAPAPPGWKLIAFAPGDAATCPLGYAEIDQVEEAPTSSSPDCTCACDCSGTANNPCVHGTFSPHIGQSCTALTLMLPTTGGCDPLGQKFMSPYASLEATPLPVTPIDVAGNAALPTLKAGTKGTTCAPAATMAGGCSGGEICLPIAATAALCIEATGDMACPAGPFTKRTVVGVPGAVDDQRTCAACSCSSSAASCTSPTFSAYADGTCSSPPANVAVIGGVCLSTATGWANDDHFKYTATPSGATCKPSGAPPAVSGSITVQAPRTICCEP